MFYIILYTLIVLGLIHFILYYMNMDILQLFNQSPDCDMEQSVIELEKSLNTLKEMNKNYT